MNTFLVFRKDGIYLYRKVLLFEDEEGSTIGQNGYEKKADELIPIDRTPGEDSLGIIEGDDGHVVEDIHRIDADGRGHGRAAKEAKDRGDEEEDGNAATDGKGYVRDGKFGNIVRIARDRPLSDPKSQEFLDYVKEEFHQFPFCARSCDFPDAEKHVRNLMRHGVLAGFATLIEAGGGMVSQHEYTFYIDGKRGEVTTLP